MRIMYCVILNIHNFIQLVQLKEFSFERNVPKAQILCSAMMPISQKTQSVLVLRTDTVKSTCPIL